MNKTNEINKILYILEQISKAENKDLDLDTVYYYITSGIVDKKAKSNKRIKDLFPDFVRYFHNTLNISVFIQPNWTYFCQFVNLPYYKQQELSNPIKMYLSVKYDDILSVATELFNFMAKNNIVHQSKIGSDVRIDDIVIRVFSKKEEKMIRDFIKENPRIKKYLMQPSPFTFQESGIGYALDRDLSYNEVISNYLKEYINSCRHSHKSVSFEGFYGFVYQIYTNVFIQKSGIKEYLKKYSTNEISNSEEYMLNNYFEVTHLMLLSLKSNDFEKFQRIVDLYNSQTAMTAVVNIFNKKNEIYSQEMKLFQEYIITMFNKYGRGDALKLINEYLNTGNIRFVTRDKNLRSKFSSFMTPDKCKKILNNLSLEQYFSKIINSENLELNGKKCILDHQENDHNLSLKK